MKKSICLVSCLLALTLTSTFGQQPASPPRTTPFPQPGITPTPASSELTKFNLDFPGGTPKELVAAIQKATGKPLNAIIPDEHANIKLPPLKMTGVDVPQLFQTLQLASAKVVAYVTGTSYGGFGGGWRTELSTNEYFLRFQNIRHANRRFHLVFLRRKAKFAYARTLENQSVLRTNALFGSGFHCG